MPRYVYQCPKCDAATEEVRPMSRSKARGPMCRRCKVYAKRSFLLEGVATDVADYAHEILSERMGVSPSQVDEHRKLFPNIPITDTGEIIVRNGAEERRINEELARAFRES